MTHICVGNLTIIGSDNGLSPGRRQAIIWTNAGILLIGPVGTKCSEISIAISFSFQKMPLKVSSTKLRPFCLGLNALRRGRGPVISTERSVMRFHQNVRTAHHSMPRVCTFLTRIKSHGEKFKQKATHYLAASEIRPFSTRVAGVWLLV